MDTHKKKDTKEANSEESSEKITEAKEDKWTIYKYGF
jgi:hypothetical protein